MGTWRQVEVGGKRADLFVPERPSPHRFTVLFLHGHGELTLCDNQVYTAELERHGLACLCPSGRRSWWGDRVCTEFDPRQPPRQFLLEAVVPWLKVHLQVEPPAIGLLGVSMGGQGGLKLAYLAPQQFPVVAALAPAIDFHRWYGQGYPLDDLYESAEEARQDTATVLIHPLNWPRHQFLLCDPADTEWFEGIERLASKLSSSGIPFEKDFETRAGGHSWDYFNHQAPVVVRFLSERLEKERLRLPTPTTPVFRTVAPESETGE
ncbi:MAG: alpha/beta hydrolase-fold protein [Planctomycetaceae bacterium]